MVDSSHDDSSGPRDAPLRGVCGMCCTRHYSADLVRLIPAGLPRPATSGDGFRTDSRMQLWLPVIRIR